MAAYWKGRLAVLAAGPIVIFVGGLILMEPFSKSSDAPRSPEEREATIEFINRHAFYARPAGYYSELSLRIDESNGVVGVLRGEDGSFAIIEGTMLEDGTIHYKQLGLMDPRGKAPSLR